MRPDLPIPEALTLKTSVWRFDTAPKVIGAAEKTLETDTAQKAVSNGRTH